MGRLYAFDARTESGRSPVRAAWLRWGILMIKSEDVLRVLGRFGVVEWGRLSVGRDPMDDLCRPPMICWRYAAPEDGVRRAIGRAVASLRGTVDWTADLASRNWVIMPERLSQDFKSHASDSYTEVLSDLKFLDQAFCVQATADLEVLMAQLEAMADSR